MHEPSIIFLLFVIFVGAAIAATVALYVRQALIIAYICVGILVGPAGFAWVTDTRFISDISHVGIIFLLFLLGLNLSPGKLIDLFKQTALVTVFSSTVFAMAGWGLATGFGFSGQDAVMTGLACMFSSTITVSYTHLTLPTKRIV